MSPRYNEPPTALEMEEWTMDRRITVRYETIDRYRETRRFKTLAGARRYASKMLGEFFDLGSTYAVSGDGVGKITCEGIYIEDLFNDNPLDGSCRKCGGTGIYKKGWEVRNCFGDLVDCGFDEVACECKAVEPKPDLKEFEVGTDDFPF